MLRYMLVFLLVAVAAGFLGLAVLAGTAAWIAKILFVVFLAMFIIALVKHTRRRA